MVATSLSSDPHRALGFLSDASKILSANLDHDETLTSLGRLSVPALADWCTVILLQPDDTLKAALIYHRDPEKVAFADEYRRRYPYMRSTRPELPKTLRDGRAVLIPHLPDSYHAAYARDEEELRILNSFGIKSQILAPLLARGRVLGLLVLASAESGRIFTEADLKIAEDLGARAGLAIDNARLYQAERAARAAAEEQLQARLKQQQMLQAITDHTGAVMYMADLEGRYLMVNRAFLEATQLSSAQVLGKTVADILPSSEEARRERAFSQAMIQSRRPVTNEISVHARDGSLKHHVAHRFPIFDEQGNVTGYGGISADVTDKRKDAEALRTSQERFEKVFRASTISICITRLEDGRFVDVNEACEQLCGYKREEMIGKTGLELGLWTSAAERARAMEELKTHGQVREFETGLRDRSGQIHDVFMSLEKIVLDGAPCILALTHDVTELKRLALGLERAQKMEALGRLAGGVAHDFNNILTAVSGYVSLALDALPPGSQPIRQPIEHVQRAVGRAASLTQQLLLFGRQQGQKPSRVDLNATIGQLLPMLQRLIGEDVLLYTALEPELLPIQADQAQLEQVILNLAINARDAMPSGGKLRLETCNLVAPDGSDSVRLAVEDNGVGMDDATRARIFEPFFTTKAVGKGTGLGLATVYSVVEHHGGRISVSSHLGHGTRFEIVFPPAAAHVGERTATPKPVVSVAAGRETILVVEDDESVLGFVCLVLEQRAYRVLTAPDGESALRVVAEHKGAIDLLLTDIVMPQMNGRALANELRKGRPGLRVMYMSGYPGDTIDRYGDIPDGEPFLQKPFTRDLLLAKVGEALRAR